MGGGVGEADANWEAAGPDAGAVEGLERRLRGLVADGAGRALLARVLAGRGVAAETAEGFLKASLKSSLRAPELMLDLERAARRLSTAVENRERIVVYGDYDVDGLAATAELVLFLGSLGVEPTTHIPDRLDEGYGLNEKVIRELAGRAPGLLITVDCGTRAHQEISLATQLGFEVIVCDHHQPDSDRPPAYAVVNPNQAGCRFPFKGLCATGVVFYLLAGTRRELRRRGVGSLPDMRDYLDLVALATIADVVPLVEENRALVRYGLRQIGRRERPGISALLDLSKVGSARAEEIAFQIAPRINAAGRIGDPRMALELLTTRDRSRARELALALERDNQRRRSIEARMTEEAIAACEALEGWPTRCSVVVSSSEWHPGVGGIVAARLAERYGLPAIVVSLDGEVGRGSGRSANGIPLNEALQVCGHLCERAGGHGGAVGFSISADRIREFALAFEESVRRLRPHDQVTDRLRPEAEVEGNELRRAVMEALELLEPCGTGNPAPVFLTKGLRIIERRAAAGRHLLLGLHGAGENGQRVEAVGFGMAAVTGQLGDRVDCIYRPRLERWRGNQRIKLYLLAVRPASGSEQPVSY